MNNGLTRQMIKNLIFRIEQILDNISKTDIQGKWYTI